MNKLFLLGLLVIVVAAKYEPRNNVDVHTELSEMSKDKFGSTFISAVEMALHTNLPIDQVSNLLDQILDEMDSKQSDSDALNQTQEAFCEETQGNLESELTTTRNSVTSAENIIAVHQEIKDNAKRNLGQAATDLDETVSALDNGTTQRETEHGTWVDSDYGYNESIVALEEASKLIKHMIHGVSFSQLRERYAKVQESLKQNTKHAVLFKPLISSLTELATKLNYEQVVHILDLLKSIQDSLESARSADAQTEEKSEDDWESLESLLTEQKRSLSDTIARLNSLITSSEEIIENTSTSLANFKNYLGYLEVTADYIEEWCEDRSQIYTEESRERGRQVGILETLQEHINDRWGAVAQFLQTRKN